MNRAARNLLAFSTLALAAACGLGAVQDGALPVTGCTVDQQCPQSYYCVAGACQQTPSRCTSTLDCTGHDVCQEGFCLAGCLATGCTAPQTCNGNSGLCQDPGTGGPPDAGTTGGTPDAGTTGGTPDAGTGGTPDAGTTGGTPDAGTTGGSALINGNFETGTLAGWSTSGSASISTDAHGGSSAAMVGSLSPTGDSALAQTVTLPAGHPALSFWYKVTCGDSVNYDWASATVSSASGALLVQALARTCAGAASWTHATVDLTSWAGQTVVLSFDNHDDNYPSDPTYTLYDDISIDQGTGTPLPTPDFALTVTPATVSTASAASSTATVAIAGSNGFAGTVSLAASGAPTGASSGLGATSVSNNGNTSLTLSAGTAAAGTYTVTIAGTSGALSHSAQVHWTITSVAPACTADTWTNWASAFFANNCANCHSHNHSWASSYSGVKSNASDSQSRISSGNMPADHSLSSSDKSRAVKWLQCNLPQ